MRAATGRTTSPSRRPAEDSFWTTSHSRSRAPAAPWALVVYGLAGMPVGSFEWQTASWSEGGNAVLNSGESIAFGSGTVSLSGVGNNFVVLGQGPVHGLTAV